MRNDFFGEMAETGGVPLNASPVRRWAGVFGHRPFAFSISMGVKTSDGMNWNLQDLGESGPFEERSAPRTKADLLREIRQRADRRTGQQEAEQRQIDPWQAQPPQRRGHGR